MAKIKAHTTYYFFCPGCGHDHAVGEQWGFNGDFNKPTFSAHSIGINQDKGENVPKGYCHSWVKDGQIQYLLDCTHDLAGQTIEMEDIE